MKRTISGLAIFVLGSLILLHLALYIGGYRFFYVKTESMEPDIHKWSLIYVRGYKEKNDFYNNIGYGMDITYISESGEPVTHRVIGINEEKDILQTKGINGDAAADAVISRDQVVGRVVKVIPVLGFFVMMIQSIYFWIILITGIIIYFVIKALAKETKKGKLKTKK